MREQFHSICVANHFLNKKEGYSSMYLHKMVYISYGFYLVLKGERLTEDKPIAYPYGPVFQDLQKACEEKRDEIGSLVFYNALPEKQSPDLERNKHLKGFLNLLWDKYGKYADITLSDFTHEKETPWTKTWDRYEKGSFIEITDTDTKNHYEKILKKSPDFEDKLKEVLENA